MPELLINNQKIALDKEGFLCELTDWSPEVAAAMAVQEGFELSESHWEVIELLRSFYKEYEVSPAMRILVKQVKQQLGPDKGNSIYLMKLFKDSPAKMASKLAGLPKPTNCI